MPLKQSQNKPMVKIKISDNLIALSGELTQLTITKSLQHKAKKFFANSSLVVDLGHIDKVDTAGLAWLLTLIEQAAQHSCEICFHNVSPELTRLAKLSAVDTFLPIK